MANTTKQEKITSCMTFSAIFKIEKECKMYMK